MMAINIKFFIFFILFFFFEYIKQNLIQIFPHIQRRHHVNITPPLCRWTGHPSNTESTATQSSGVPP